MSPEDFDRDMLGFAVSLVGMATGAAALTLTDSQLDELFTLANTL